MSFMTQRKCTQEEKLGSERRDSPVLGSISLTLHPDLLRVLVKLRSTKEKEVSATMSRDDNNRHFVFCTLTLESIYNQTRGCRLLASPKKSSRELWCVWESQTADKRVFNPRLHVRYGKLANNQSNNTTKCSFNDFPFKVLVHCTLEERLSSLDIHWSMKPESPPCIHTGMYLQARKPNPNTQEEDKPVIWPSPSRSYLAMVVTLPQVVKWKGCSVCSDFLGGPV